MKFMKLSLFSFLFISILPLALCACGSDDESPYDKNDNEEESEEEVTVKVSPVTNLKAEGTLKANELQLSWNTPSDIVMVEIAYWMDGNEDSKETEMVRGKSELLISVPEYGTYRISATSIDNYGRRAESVEITATPYEEDAPTEIVQVNDKLPIADPYCFYYEGKYYAYGTGWASGFPVYTSTDLVHWTEARALQDTDSWQGSNKTWWWAPEVYQYNNLFYMFYVNSEHICVARSTSGPDGPFRQSEKKPLISAYNNIDPSFFIDDDGTPYLYFVTTYDGNVIKVAELAPDLQSIKEETITECIRATEDWEKIQGEICEGPSLIKKDGVYYLLYSANHYQCKDYAVGYATADSPYGPWKKYNGNPILRRDLPGAGGLTGVGHGAPFQCGDGTWKYIFHAHESANAVGKRTSYINDLHFSASGEISISGELIKPVVVEEQVIER